MSVSDQLGRYPIHAGATRATHWQRLEPDLNEDSAVTSPARALWSTYEASPTDDEYKNVIKAYGHRGMDVMFYGNGANNQAFNWELWALHMLGLPHPNNSTPMIVPLMICSGTAAITSGIGIAGGLIPNTYEFAKSITFTNTADSTTNAAEYGYTLEQAFSMTITATALDTGFPPILAVPDLGSPFAVSLRIDGGNLTAGSGALYRLIT